jgi:hypothetical protein
MMMATERMNIPKARLMVSEEKVRLKACTFTDPVSLERMRARKTPSVLTLTPPPVEPGAAPINISMIVPRRLMFVMRE